MSKITKITKRSPNGFLQFRREIRPAQGTTMAKHSKEASHNWTALPETVKRRYFHLAKREEVKNEAAKGKNPNTVKTFELGENFSFVIETPKPQLENNISQNGSNINFDEMFDQYFNLV